MIPQSMPALIHDATGQQTDAEIIATGITQNGRPVVLVGDALYVVREVGTWQD